MDKRFLDIVYEAGKELRRAASIEIAEKSDFKNLVTQYDVKTQEFLICEFDKIIPGSVFLCEEKDNDKGAIESAGHLFIIDPIDGTTNFIKGYNLSAISVGYAENGEMKWGIVYNPFTDEMYYAEKGKGAYKNGERIRVTDNELNGCLVAFGTSPYEEEYKIETLKLVSEILKYCIDVRRLGSAAIDLCHTAEGKCGLYFERMLSPWDYAGGMMILKEAGGIVRNFEGDEPSGKDKSSMIAGNEKCVKSFLNILNSRQ